MPYAGSGQGGSGRLAGRPARCIDRYRNNVRQRSGAGRRRAAQRDPNRPGAACLRLSARRGLPCARCLGGAAVAGAHRQLALAERRGRGGPLLRHQRLRHGHVGGPAGRRRRCVALRPPPSAPRGAALLADDRRQARRAGRLGRGHPARRVADSGVAPVHPGAGRGRHRPAGAGCRLDVGLRNAVLRPVRSGHLAPPARFNASFAPAVPDPPGAGRFLSPPGLAGAVRARQRAGPGILPGDGGGGLDARRARTQHVGRAARLRRAAADPAPARAMAVRALGPACRRGAGRRRPAGATVRPARARLAARRG